MVDMTAISDRIKKAGFRSAEANSAAIERQLATNAKNARAKAAKYERDREAAERRKP
jgi:hypothetical protein